MKTTHQKLTDIELDISNLMLFISQCMEKLQQRTQEYMELKKEMYVEDGIRNANIYANEDSK